MVNWLRGAGYAVPQQASVVGIGGTLLAQFCRPRLVTVDVGLAESGRAALDFIAARGADATAPPRMIGPPRLLAGDSIASNGG
jgi:DNA-binding LacI/PurR family transcriptional regulator